MFVSMAFFSVAMQRMRETSQCLIITLMR